jgi:hypothetical protein
MDAATALAQHRAFINEIGEDIAIRRYAEDGTYTDTTTKARVIGAEVEEFTGSMTQKRSKVIALVDTLASILPLVPTDKAVIGGREFAIEGIDDNTRRIGGTLVALEFQVIG